jgi:hypothetical protein
MARGLPQVQDASYRSSIDSSIAPKSSSSRASRIGLKKPKGVRIVTSADAVRPKRQNISPPRCVHARRSWRIQEPFAASGVQTDNPHIEFISNRYSLPRATLRRLWHRIILTQSHIMTPPSSSRGRMAPQPEVGIAVSPSQSDASKATPSLGQRCRTTCTVGSLSRLGRTIGRPLFRGSAPFQLMPHRTSDAAPYLKVEQRQAE